MAADYWTSTQRMHWQFSRDALINKRNELKQLEKTMEESHLISKVPINYDIYMRIFIHSLINKLGRRLSIRQVALSTAEVYIMRFLTRVSLKEINLYLLITTAIYLACKIEECPQHIRTIVSEARNLWPEYIPHDATKLAEFEFYLIEELDTYLIVHHPYRSLLLINETLNSIQQSTSNKSHIMPTISTSNSNNPGTINHSTNNNQFLVLSAEELQSSWSIINDSYVTDLPLIYPPHIIATAAIYLTIILKYNHLTQVQKDQASLKNGSSTNSKAQTLTNSKIQINPEALKNFIGFLGYSNIDLESVIEAIQELITLYEVWETYDENNCKKPLAQILLNRA